MRYHRHWLLGLLLLLAWPILAPAATYYTDHQCGTITTYNPTTRACTGGTATSRDTVTVGLALLAAGNPGDILDIRAGTYAERISNPALTGISYGQPFTIRGHAGEVVVIRVSGTTPIVTFAGSARRYIILENLVIDGSLLTGSGGTGIRFSGLGSDVTNSPHHIRMRNITIRNTSGIGWSASSGAAFNEFLDGEIFGTGRSGIGHGMYISGPDNLVAGNRIHDNHKCGIQLFY